MYIARKFSWRKFWPFSPPAFMGDIFLPGIFLSSFNDYIEPMMIFTTWAKIYSVKYFCNARIGALGDFFVCQKISSSTVYDSEHDGVLTLKVGPNFQTACRHWQHHRERPTTMYMYTYDHQQNLTIAKLTIILNILILISNMAYLLSKYSPPFLLPCWTYNRHQPSSSYHLLPTETCTCTGEWVRERQQRRAGRTIIHHVHYMHVLSTTFYYIPDPPPPTSNCQVHSLEGGNTKLSHKQVPYKLYISMQQSAELALLLLTIVKDFSNCWLWTTHRHKHNMRVKSQTTRLPYHIYMYFCNWKGL